VDNKGVESAASNTVSVTPAAIVIPIGLSPALISIAAQNNATWTQYTADISNYIGKTVRFVIKSEANGAYTGDNQIDDISVGGNTYNPEDGTNSFQRANSTSTTLEYTGVTWENLADGTTGGRWNRDSDGTPSSNTGNTAGYTGTYYYYTEVTSNYNTGLRYWLRGPECTVSNGTLSLYVAQNGASCGPIEVYLDVIS
jgi:hypothetical protein